jgi:hypothetical protein
MWWGANPKAQADATPAFDRLVDTLNNSTGPGGGRVWVPAGHYVFQSGGLTTITRDNIYWENDPAVILNMQTADEALLTVTATNFSMRGGEIKSSPRQSGSTYPTTGIELNLSRNCSFRDMKLHLLDRGIYITNAAYYNTFDTVWLHNCAWSSGIGTQVTIDTGSNDNRFFGVRFGGGADTGLLIRGTSGQATGVNLFSGCSFETDSGLAQIDISGVANNNLFIGCRIEGPNHERSIRISAEAQGNMFLRCQHSEKINEDRSHGKNYFWGTATQAGQFPDTINNYLQNAGFSQWSGGDNNLPDVWFENGGAGSFAKETTEVFDTTVSARMTKTASLTDYVVANDFSEYLGYLENRQVTQGCWVKTDISGGYDNHIISRVRDGNTTSQSAALNVSDDWSWLGSSYTVSSGTATQLRYELVIASGFPNSRPVYFSKPMVVEGDGIINTTGAKLLQDSGGTVYGNLTVADTLTTQSLSVPSGVVAASGVTITTDVEVTQSGNGLVLLSPGGTRYRVQVDNTGSLVTTAV